MKTKTILALLKSARESAPCELEHGLVKLPRNKKCPKDAWGQEIKPHGFHEQRREEIAQALEKARFEKITIAHDGFKLTVWNTKQALSICIKNLSKSAK